MALIFGLYRPSSGPIALRNVLKCSTWHTFFTIRFWHFSSAAFIEKNAERVPMLVRDNKWCRIVYALQTTRDVHRGNNSDGVPLPLAEMSPGHSSILVASQSHRHRTYCYGECHLWQSHRQLDTLLDNDICTTRTYCHIGDVIRECDMIGVARFIDASIYCDTFPAIRIAIFFL